MFYYKFYNSKVGLWETKSGVIFKETGLSVGTPVNNAGHNHRNEKAGQDVQLQMKLLVFKQQFS